MQTILVLNASARRRGSLTRSLSDKFVSHWKRLQPQDEEIHRDLGADPPPMLSEAWMAACFTPDEQQTAEHRQVLAYSDRVIEELRSADLVVMAVPRYNYGMPAVLKAWFDQVIRIRRTFHFDRNEKTWPLSPLLHGKRLVVLSASGEFDFRPDGIRAHWDHLLPHIRTCAHYIGVAPRDIHHVGIEYQEFGDDRHARSVADAHESIERLARQLAAARPAG